MNGLKALGHMLVEEGLILAIRQKEKGIRFEYGDIYDVGYDLIVSPDIFKLEGWELGWKCPTCQGDGLTTFPCNCGACPGYDEAPCTRCDGGIKWEDEY